MAAIVYRVEIKRMRIGTDTRVNKERVKQNREKIDQIELDKSSPKSLVII